MTVNEFIQIAKDQGLNPYFFAYMLEHDLKDKSDFNSWEYSAWNGKRWEEYRKQFGKDRYDFISEKEKEDFIPYLVERVKDKVSPFS